jgi:hypothetical protein
MKQLVQTIKGWFGSDDSEPKETCKKEYISPKDLEKYVPQAIEIPEMVYHNEFDKNRPTILLMDDYEGMIQLLMIELKRIQCCNIMDTFNIVYATGDMAAFAVKKYLENDGKVDVAFLDITIGGIIENVELDGIDISILIKEKFKKSQIRFLTGHTLNKKNPEIFLFMKKFKDATGLDIDEKQEIEYLNEKHEITKYVIGKNTNRILLMALAIEKYLDIKI